MVVILAYWSYLSSSKMMIPTGLKKTPNGCRRSELKRGRTEHDDGEPFESRIVSEDELTACLDEGWGLVKELCNGKI